MQAKSVDKNVSERIQQKGSIWKLNTRKVKKQNLPRLLEVD